MHKKLGIVLVVYKRKLEESEGYRILMKLHASHKEVFNNIDMLVINNHKEYQQKNENKAYSFQDLSSKNTLLDAYLFGVNFFSKKKINWTLFCHHDTELTLNYLKNILKILTNYKELDRVGMIVPHVTSNSKFISPCLEKRGGIVRPLKLKSSRYLLKSVYAVGSGMVVDNNFFKTIINKNVYYKIDFIDIYICDQIAKSKKYFLISNSVHNQSLSVFNFENEMNVSRYKKIVHYEYFFMKHERPSFDFLVYKLRIIKRILIFLLNKKLFQYLPVLLKSLLRDF